MRFHRSIDATVASIAEHSRLRRLHAPGGAAGEGCVDGPGEPVKPRQALQATATTLWSLLQGLKRAGGPVGLAHDLVRPYGTLLATALPSELTRAPVAYFASHSSAGPHTLARRSRCSGRPPTTCSGSGTRAEACRPSPARWSSDWRGKVRTGAVVERIEARDGRATGVVLEDGSRLAAAAVVSAVVVQTALLELLDPPYAAVPALSPPPPTDLAQMEFLFLSLA